MRADEISWACASCGKVHRGLPAISFDAPSHYYGMPEEERRKRALLNSDNCVVDNAAFYVRTALKVPIIGRSEMLEWGVWSSLSEKKLHAILSDIRRPGSEQARADVELVLIEPAGPPKHSESCEPHCATRQSPAPSRGTRSGFGSPPHRRSTQWDYA